jgi:hypothetical protein
MATQQYLARVVAVVGIAVLILVSPVRGQQSPENGDDAGAAVGSDGRIELEVGTDDVLILDADSPTTCWVGIVAHNDGAADSRWRSDVIISHEADHDVGVEFILHTQHGKITAEASIGPWSQGVFEDIVGLLGYEGKGTLEIRPDFPVRVVSRIYSETDSGTSGAYFPGYRSCDCLGSGETVWFYGLRQMQGKYRTNINITNTGTEPGRVYITLYQSDGFRLMAYPVDVDPGEVVQELQPFKIRRDRAYLGWGFASVSVESGSMLVSATVIDSRTNHPMMVPMTR